MSQNHLEISTVTVDTPLVEAAQFSWRDLLGVVASISCAIHCAVMPIAIGYLPLLGLEFLADESFHQWMVLICFGIALFAFVPGWRKHRSVLPTAVGALGLSVIAGAAFFVTDSCCAADGGSAVAATDSGAHVCTESCCQHSEDQPETSGDVAMASIAPISLLTSYASWLTPLGGLMLVGAHLLNHRYSCRRHCCSPDQTLFTD